VKLVSLNVPARVKKGSEVQLSCLYDLGNASLYSLKWFYRENDRDREEKEFFRYTPRTKTLKQVFPLDGIKVDVSFSLFKILENLFERKNLVQYRNDYISMRTTKCCPRVNIKLTIIVERIFCF
jgi:hypothetical protein